MQLVRVTVASALAFVALGALAGAADAHVTVTSPGATRGGGDQAITFRVPVEKAVDTVAITIVLPTDTPIASVDVVPVVGWTHTEKSVTLKTPIKTDDGDITSAVSQVSWTAERGQGLVPGEAGEFSILAGQLPDVPSITFKALQTYADGSVVKWIEVAAPGSTNEPDHPAPVLTLAAANPAGSAPSTAPSTAPSASVTFSKATTSSSSNTGPVVLSIIALVLAAAALGVAVVGRARGRAA